VENSVCVIFGATGSVGASLCRLLARNGVSVLAAARSEEKLAMLKEELGVSTAQVQLEQPETLATAFEAAEQQFGAVHGVANCIGTLLLKPAHQVSDDDWQQTLDVNLTSSFRILKAAVKSMRRDGGSIVFLSTAAALTGMANHEAIAAAKAGLLGMSRSAAATYAAKNIRVNCVSPGLVQSNMSRHLWEDEKIRGLSEQMNPLGRLGQPDDIARMVCWLLDPENSWVTGQNFGVDGGLATLIQRPKTKV